MSQDTRQVKTNLDCTGAKGNELYMQICTWAQTDNHAAPQHSLYHTTWYQPIKYGIYWYVQIDRSWSTCEQIDAVCIGFGCYAIYPPVTYKARDAPQDPLAYVKMRRHPQNPKYATYRNAAREWPIYGHSEHAQKTSASDEVQP